MNNIQTLLYDALLYTGHVEHAAVIRRRDMGVHATTKDFTLNRDDVVCIMDAFRNSAAIRENGITIFGMTYTCVRADQDSVYAKSGKNGLVAVKTKNHIIFATYNDNMYPSVCVEAVEKLAHYLKDKDK